MRNDRIELVAGRLLIISLAALSLVLSGCAATSQPHMTQEGMRKLDFQVGPGPYNFECDAPGGRYQESNVSTSGDKLRATGTMRFLALRSHPGWAASATITFADSTGKQPFMGLQAIVMPDEPDSIQFAITGHGGAQDRSVFAITPVTDAWIPFEVKLSKAGELEVSVAGQGTRIAVSVIEPSRLTLFCSTAFVHFSNVLVENVH
jgi:hypothetical protein